MMSFWQMLRTLTGGSVRMEISGEPEQGASAGPQDPQDDDAEASSEPIQLEVTDVLDLHPFAPRDVKAVVEAYLEEARAKAFSTVRIIHGKGAGVQRSMVRSLLARTPFVTSFEDAPMGAGSWGATVVWFSRGSQKREDRKEAGGN